MNTNTINKKIIHYKSFLGTFPCDKIPEANARPVGVNVNTDYSNQPGTHYVAIYISERNVGEYFDFFGIPPLKTDIIKYLDRHCSRWCFSPFALQGLKATTCGNYSIFLYNNAFTV